MRTALEIYFAANIFLLGYGWGDYGKPQSIVDVAFCLVALLFGLPWILAISAWDYLLKYAVRHIVFLWKFYFFKSFRNWTADDLKRANSFAKQHGTSTWTGKLFNYHTRMMNRRYKYTP